MKIRKNKDGSIMVGSLRISRGGFAVIGGLVGFLIYFCLGLTYQ